MYRRQLKNAIKEARESIIHELIRRGEIPKPVGHLDYHGIYRQHRDQVDDVLRRVIDDLLLAD